MWVGVGEVAESGNEGVEVGAVRHRAAESGGGWVWWVRWVRWVRSGLGHGTRFRTTRHVCTVTAGPMLHGHAHIQTHTYTHHARVQGEGVPIPRGICL